MAARLPSGTSKIDGVVCGIRGTARHARNRTARDTGTLGLRKTDMAKASDNIVLVTGAGASIGAATARRYASEGARVIAADYHADR